ncbi:MAG: lytic murein transglycosylase [Alphaproteobacteria bacterium]|nr:lytic murein transglycosylase [Alphaproteobacteria bacterium]
MNKIAFMCLVCVAFASPSVASTVSGSFDLDRWYAIVEGVRSRATSENISPEITDATLKSVALIPSILKSDKNQSEFKLTLDGYLQRTVNPTRISTGRRMRKTYPTLLSRVESRFGVPPHVMLAFWGMESNYGAVKSRHRLIDAFFTLMYDGRRETFFTNQLLALMRIADKNNLDINGIHGSWAGAMGHFQFIPTTLNQYGVDGDGDKRTDIINNLPDAMFSAGNYLNKLGWNKNERIVRRVVLPSDFDISMLDGKTKLTLPQWAALGVTNPDGSPLPSMDMTAGLVADVAQITQMRADAAQQSVSAMDTDIAPMPVINAYLTYPNFYRIKRWNNSNWYAIAIAELADELH